MTDKASLDTGIPSGVERLIKLAEGLLAAPVAETSPIAGDASRRAYIRLRHPEGEPPTSVGMILPEPFEEDTLPFINVQAHFRAVGLPVPEILATDPRAGVLLLEDGGEQTLEDLWQAGGWDAARPYYEESISVLISLQNAPADKKGCLALGYGFDASLFERELHMTRRCALEALCGIAAPEADFDGPFSALARALCDLPYVLTHRDYHSRNIMAGGMTGGPEKKTGRLFVLDFQDARLGPATYDLASLVYDSYVPLPQAARAALIEKFWEESNARNIFSDRPAFDRALSLTALQRNLKAIGTFAYQKTERGNPRYIQYISLTAEHTRRHLAALAGLDGFAAQLEPYIRALENAEEKETVH